MGGPISVPVPATAVGGTQDISVPLIAPSAPGEHKGYWRLRAANGVQFGDKIYVKIQSIPPTPTPTPTLTPTTPAPPAIPDLYVSAFSFSPSTPVADSPVHVSITIYNKGTAAVSTPFLVHWYGGENFANPSCKWLMGVTIPKNSGRIVECDFTFVSWYFGINTKVIVDVNDSVEESNEANNIFLKKIDVSKP